MLINGITPKLIRCARKASDAVDPATECSCVSPVSVRKGIFYKIRRLVRLFPAVSMAWLATCIPPAACPLDAQDEMKAPTRPDVAAIQPVAGETTQEADMPPVAATAEAIPAFTLADTDTTSQENTTPSGGMSGTPGTAKPAAPDRTSPSSKDFPGIRGAITTIPAETTDDELTFIECDSLVMEGSETTNTFYFRENVRVAANNLLVVCDNMRVISSRTGKENATVGDVGDIQQIEAVGNVLIRQAGRRALAGRAVFYPEREEIILSENPRVIDDESEVEVTGWKMVIRTGERRVQVLPNPDNPSRSTVTKFGAMPDFGFDPEEATNKALGQSAGDGGKPAGEPSGENGETNDDTAGGDAADPADATNAERAEEDTGADESDAARSSRPPTARRPAR